MPEQVLRDAENASIDDNRSPDSDGAVDEARSAEGRKYHSYQDYLDSTNGEKDTFRSTVSGHGAKDNKKNAKAKFSDLKKKGPLVAILVLLCVIMGLIVLAHSVMPFAIVNRVIEEFNTNGISSVLRADNILDYQMSTRNDTFGLTNYQKNSFEQYGILHYDFSDSTVLVYETTERGTWNVVHGTVPENPNTGEVESYLKSKYSDRVFKKMNSVTIEEAMVDSNFKTPYTTASKTWRGGNSGWYDTLASLNDAIRGVSRSRFFASGVLKGRIATSIAARNIMKGRTITKFDSSDAVPDESSEGIKANDSSHGRFSKASLNAAASVVQKASMVATGYCMYIEAANRVQSIIRSVATLQQMNLISGFGEAVQMVQAGYDNQGTVMNEYATNLVTADDTGKSAIEYMPGLLNGTPNDPDDENVKAATSEGAFAKLSQSTNPVSTTFAKIAEGATDFLGAMTECTYIKGFVGVISSVIRIVGVATGGIATLVEFGIQFVIGVIAGITIQYFLGLLVDWFWDNYGEVLAKDLATELIGPRHGTSFESGANKLPSSNHQIGGGSPASKDQVIAFRRQQEIVLAEEAEYQRSVRSPFDITSQHTFLGSIVYSLIPIATSSSLGSTLRNISSTITGSINKLLPSTSAIAETNLINSFGDCPTLESIGIAGDIYCNPYFISDVSTNTSVAMLKKLGDYDVAALDTNNYYWKGTGNNSYLSPSDVVDKVYNLKGIKSKTPTRLKKGDKEYLAFEVIEGSNLAKHAQLCGPRTADWGFADPSAVDVLEKNRQSQWWNKIPFVSSITSMIEAGKDKEWISGSNCVARTYNTSCSVNDSSSECYWQNEGRYYQRFFEDQRYIINAGTNKIEEDVVTIALTDYYDENPLDQSFEGILARYSGMTKDDVIATLELIEGLNYLANYHPEERLAFGVEESDNTIFFEQTTNDFAQNIAIEPKYIIYDTLRNKATIG